MRMGSEGGLPRSSAQGSHALCRQITDRQLAENNLGTGLVDRLELVEDDLPLGVDNGLVLRHLLNTNLRIVLLTLQLQLHVETHDLGILEVLWLLLKTGVGESLLEGNAVDEERILKTTAGDLLHTDQFLIQVILIQRQNGIDHH